MPLTTLIKNGVWEVVDIGNKYQYRVSAWRNSHYWTIFKKLRERVLEDTADASPDAPKWELVDSGYESKESAVEHVVELAAREEFNPYADLLNNIDDGIDLNNEEG